jgi:two-component system nitrate/nitrite response regulator NarL
MPLQAQPVSVIVGLDRLFHEIVAETVSNHGWQIHPFGDMAASIPEADVVLVFTSGPLELVIRAISAARTTYPLAKIVLLTNEINDPDLVQCIEAGINAYVVSSQSLTDLVNTIQMVHENKTLSSGRITQLVVGGISKRTRDVKPRSRVHLTSREAEILQLVGEGLSNKEIAERLSITANTVKNHIHHILEKLKAKNRHEASWMKSRVRQGFPRAG